MQDDRLMGRNAYARHRGCAPNAVRKAEADGRIAAAVEREPDGTFRGIDWRRADDLWALNTDPAEAAKQGKTIEAPAGAGAGDLVDQATRETAAPPARLSAGKDHGYFKARAEREEIDRRLSELDLHERMGLLISSAEVREANARRYRSLRDQLLNVPDRVALLLPVPDDVQAQCRALMTQEIEQALYELSDNARAAASGGAA